LKELHADELKEIAEARKTESLLLFDNHLYNGSYYLGGYSAECAIKVLIALKMKEFIFPDKNFANAVWTHDLKKLIDKSAISKIFNNKVENDPEFSANWSKVNQWNESSRYEQIPVEKANDLINALYDVNKGIYTWLRNNW